MSPEPEPEPEPEDDKITRKVVFYDADTSEEVKDFVFNDTERTFLCSLVQYQDNNVEGGDSVSTFIPLEYDESSNSFSITFDKNLNLYLYRSEYTVIHPEDSRVAYNVTSNMRNGRVKRSTYGLYSVVTNFESGESELVSTSDKYGADEIKVTLYRFPEFHLTLQEDWESKNGEQEGYVRNIELCVNDTAVVTFRTFDDGDIILRNGESYIISSSDKYVVKADEYTTKFLSSGNALIDEFGVDWVNTDNFLRHGEVVDLFVKEVITGMITRKLKFINKTTGEEVTDFSWKEKDKSFAVCFLQFKDGNTENDISTNVVEVPIDYDEATNTLSITFDSEMNIYLYGKGNNNVIQSLRFGWYENNGLMVVDGAIRSASVTSKGLYARQISGYSLTTDKVEITSKDTIDIEVYKVPEFVAKIPDNFSYTDKEDYLNVYMYGRAGSLPMKQLMNLTDNEWYEPGRDLRLSYLLDEDGGKLNTEYSVDFAPSGFDFNNNNPPLRLIPLDWNGITEVNGVYQCDVDKYDSSLVKVELKANYGGDSSVPEYEEDNETGEASWLFSLYYESDGINHKVKVAYNVYDTAYARLKIGEELKVTNNDNIINSNGCNSFRIAKETGVLITKYNHCMLDEHELKSESLVPFEDNIYTIPVISFASAEIDSSLREKLLTGEVFSWVVSDKVSYYNGNSYVYEDYDYGYDGEHQSLSECLNTLKWRDGDKYLISFYPFTEKDDEYVSYGVKRIMTFTDSSNRFITSIEFNTGDVTVASYRYAYITKVFDKPVIRALFYSTEYDKIIPIDKYDSNYRDIAVKLVAKVNNGDKQYECLSLFEGGMNGGFIEGVDFDNTESIVCMTTKSISETDILYSEGKDLSQAYVWNNMMYAGCHLFTSYAYNRTDFDTIPKIAYNANEESDIVFSISNTDVMKTIVLLLKDLNAVDSESDNSIIGEYGRGTIYKWIRSDTESWDYGKFNQYGGNDPTPITDDFRLSGLYALLNKGYAEEETSITIYSDDSTMAKKITVSGNNTEWNASSVVIK